MIYLDNNATTQPSEGVIEAMSRVQREAWANPSSTHRLGQEARREIDLARAEVAKLIGARPREITFTSGGTESISMAIRGTIGATGRRVVVTTAVEHIAFDDLLEELEREGRVETRRVEVDSDGVIKRGSLEAALGDDVALACVQWANNETGAIQPVEDAAEMCAERGVLLHIDATQIVGKMPIAPGQTPGDVLTCSPHKFHGPKGVGVLRMRAGVTLRAAQPGSQEAGRRGGTENVAGIVGLGVAAREAAAWLADPAGRQRVAALRDRFEQRVLAAHPEARLMGPADNRLWNTSNIAFAGIESETLLILLSERGVCASAGSACSSGAVEPSRVIRAMGVEPRLASGAVRFSLSRHTTEAEVEEASETVIDSVSQLLNMAM